MVPPVLYKQESLPLLPSPYKREAWTFSLFLPLSGRVRGNRLTESSASGLFSNQCQPTLEEVDKTSLCDRPYCESLAVSPRLWLEHIKPIRHDFSRLSQFADPALYDISLRHTAMVRLMADVDSEAIQEVTMPKKPRSRHVIPNTNGGWDVKKDGAIRSSGHFDKKQDAVDVEWSGR